MFPKLTLEVEASPQSPFCSGSSRIIGAPDCLSSYEEKCRYPPKPEELLTFDYGSSVDVLSEITLTGGLLSTCDGVVTVDEGLNLLDKAQTPVSPVSDCSLDSGLPRSNLASTSTEEQFLVDLFGPDISLSLQPSSPASIPSPTSSTFSQSQLPVEGKQKDYLDEVDHGADKYRGGKVSEAMAERNRRNAEAARQNRLKKKKYVEGLEKDCSSLKTENVVLKAKCHEYQSKCQRLQSEVTYLRSVLANDSALADLLQHIPNAPKVMLSSSFRKRPNPNGQPSAAKNSKLSEATTTTGGVCLHVAKDSVSLELCDACSRR